jgi:hypothetical protein
VALTVDVAGVVPSWGLFFVWLEGSDAGQRAADVGHGDVARVAGRLGHLYDPLLGSSLAVETQTVERVRAVRDQAFYLVGRSEATSALYCRRSLVVALECTTAVRTNRCLPERSGRATTTRRYGLRA